MTTDSLTTMDRDANTLSSSGIPRSLEHETERVEAKLNIYFALLACLSGLTLASNTDLQSMAVVAIFFALLGLVFVDLLHWFALPPTMAYIMLGGIAFYTINRFITIGSLAAEPQMIVVAELLVLVQSVLVMQRKTRRIYEQLAVFSLLLLIVSAIFNNAVSYGLLLVPLSAVAIGALSLLHVYSTAEDAFTKRSSGNAEIRVSSATSRSSFLNIARPLPKIGMLTIGPSVLAVAIVFFYALPRTNQIAQNGLGGAAQVGFNKEVKLGQIGQMMLNPQVAARFQLRNRRTELNYGVVGNIYVRGAVLEDYQLNQNFEGSWHSSPPSRSVSPRTIPSEGYGLRDSDRLFSDEVLVEVTVMPIQGESLFSLPPYFRDATNPDVVHVSDRWTLERKSRPLLLRQSQISYRFASLGFREGVQSRFLPRRISTVTAYDATSEANASSGGESTQLSSSEQRARALEQIEERESIRAAGEYTQQCLNYDGDSVPTAEMLASRIARQMSNGKERPVEIALAMERYLAESSEFSYSLNLTMDPLPGMDPIEQFLSVDKKGNCQYYASALVLMLRSQGIPARLVVGFSTDEYNALGGYYVARQLHAHAWVEALVDAKWLKPNELYYAESPPDQYWFRLDPTPGGGGSNVRAGGRVSDVLDLAQDLWTNYVVDADAKDRRGKRGDGTDELTGTYQLYYEWVKLKIARIRAGELGAGSLAGRDLFSLPSAVFGVVFSLGIFLVYHFGWVGRLFRSSQSKSTEQTLAVPKIVFFAETVSLLERMGIKRRIGQTAQEYTESAAKILRNEDSASVAAPLSFLTAAFYFARFSGNSVQGPTAETRPDSEKIAKALQRIRDRVNDQDQVTGKVRGTTE